jgi:hypothetical protein
MTLQEELDIRDQIFNYNSCLKRTRVALGEGHLDKFTIFEDKSCFSIYFHIFNTIAQDRFHTHAFDGYSYVLRGGYEEEYKVDGVVHKKWVGTGGRFIPKNYNHRILRSEPDTMSILFTGPWDNHWTEENDQFVRTLTHGRKEVSREYRI